MVKFSLAFLKSADVISPKVDLNVGGRDGVKTYFGTLLSFIYVFGSVYWAYMTVSEFFSTANPFSYAEVFVQEEYPYIDLKAGSMVPLFFAYAGETDSIAAENITRYLTIEAIKTKWISKVVNGEAVTENELSKFETVPCSQLTESEKPPYEYLKNSKYLTEMMSNYGICIRSNNTFSVSGKGSDEIFETITYALRPCSLPNPADCANLTEMKLLNFYLLMPSTSIDHANYAKPTKLISTADDIFYLSPNYKQIYTAKLKTNEVSDFRGFNPEWTVKEKFYDLALTTTNSGARDESQIYCTPTEITDNSPDCISYFEYVIQSTGIINRQKRRYKEFTDTIGDIGGTKEVIYLLVMLLYWRYNSISRDNYLIRKVFSFFGELQNHNSDPASSNKSKNENPEKKIGLLRFSIVRMYCCCLKRRTLEAQNYEELRNSALENIESNLDILTLVREINNLKVLTHFFFKTRHFKLTPYLALNLYRKKQAEKNQFSEIKDQGLEEKFKESLTRNLSSINLSGENTADMYSYKDMYRQLQLELEKSSGEGPGDLTKQLDTYYYQTIKTSEESINTHHERRAHRLNSNGISIPTNKTNFISPFETPKARLDSLRANGGTNFTDLIRNMIKKKTVSQAALGEIKEENEDPKDKDEEQEGDLNDGIQAMIRNFEKKEAEKKRVEDEENLRGKNQIDQNGASQTRKDAGSMKILLPHQRKSNTIKDGIHMKPGKRTFKHI